MNLFNIPEKTRALATISLEIDQQARTMNACNYAIQVLKETGLLEVDFLKEEFARASKMVVSLMVAKEIWENK
jgi:hypothetical protein